MTPKEKAKELVSEFYEYTTGKVIMGGRNYRGRNAIKCALICCKYILSDMGSDRGYQYWEQVKTEIDIY